MDEYEAGVCLLAGIIEQANLDATGVSTRFMTQRHKPMTARCKATGHYHLAKDCAAEFLAKVQGQVGELRKPTVEDLAQIILEVTE
jgi:hypothetical protein